MQATAPLPTQAPTTSARANPKGNTAVSDPNIQDVIEGFPTPCVLVGPAGKVLHNNTAAQLVLGSDFQDRSYLVALRQPSLVDAVETCLSSGEAARTQFVERGLARDRTFQAHLRPVPLGDAHGVLVTFEDVSSVGEMAQIHRDFVANVSHELRTPLTAMLGFLETLNGPAQKDAKARDRFMGLMAAEGRRMNSLVDDLLSLSHVEAHMHVRPTDTVDLVALVDAAVARNADFAQTHNATVTCDFAKQVPAITADAGQIDQVLTNLLQNACKYGVRPEGGLVEVSLRYIDHHPTLRSAAVRLDVLDHGMGIEDVDIPRLTERFYRVDAHRSRDVGGTGLGLAIVKHIVNRHRGRLNVRSELGKGSVFSVVLPV